MDYFGQVLEDITDLWNDIDRSPYAAEAKPLLKVLERAMTTCVALERARTAATGKAKAASPQARLAA